MILLDLRHALRERTRSALTSAGVACAVVLTAFLVGGFPAGIRPVQ